MIQTVATNIRFQADEYEELRQMAFLARKSIASLIREAVNAYKTGSINTQNSGAKLYQKIVNEGCKINSSVAELVQNGRKFE